MASQPADETFEVVYRRLEEVVARLEAGGLALAEALALYEEGVRLFQRCQAMLESAQLRVSRLQEGLAVAPPLAETAMEPEELLVDDEAADAEG